MLEKLVNKLLKIFETQSYESQLQQYIESKNPQTPGDVDYWQRRFDQRTYSQGQL